jgi:hypothetical protein
MHRISPVDISNVISNVRLNEFCHRWKIVALALFGSATQDGFGPESDIDLLATFAPDARWSLLDHMQMELELAALLGREVDLIDRANFEKRARESQIVEILGTAQPVYIAPELSREQR